MKALVCDLCGCMVPDVPEASLIQGVTITRGGSVVLERDVCLTCLEKLIMGFECIDFVALEGAKVVPGIVSEISDSDFTPGVSEAIDFTLAMAELKQTLEPAPEANKVAPEAIKVAPDVAESLFKVTHITTVDHVKFQPDEDIAPVKGTRPDNSDPGNRMVICEYCEKEFVARSKRSRFCSHKCENHDWLDKRKLKNETPEQKKIRTDALLKKLKAENPAPIERPNIYHEM